MHDKKIGPDAACWIPEEIDSSILNQVSTKTLNLCSSVTGDIPKLVELITFPALELKGLIKCFSLDPADTTSNLNNATLTLLFNDANDAVYYKYINEFNPLFEEEAEHFKALHQRAASKEDMMSELEHMSTRIMELLEEFFMSELPPDKKEAFVVDEQRKSTKRLYRFKIIVIGDPEVGKTSLILRFTDNAFRKTYIMSIGVNVTTKVIELEDAQVEFVIWDIAGQSKFDIARRAFYEGARGQLLVFDLTRPATHESIVKWYKDIKATLKENIPGFVIGNKADLVGQIAVSKEDVEKAMFEIPIPYIEASALTGKNVQSAFIKLAQELVLAYKK